MDIICPRCGEPMAVDELHYFDMPFDQARKTFFNQGCGVLTEGRPCEPVRNERTAAAQAFYDLLGDDIDGIASELDDWGLT